ncbi:hypothetical protein Tco_1066524 [Tanacetum coccineum]|uniref:Uncharacterized protein n=1 Tax=Tanacetum coccineum TaxID=301880 RepID=A0ABQ5HC24_9ASTR
MVEIGRKRSKSVKNGRSQRKSFENGQKQSKSVEICRNRSKTVETGRKRLKSAKWSKTVKNGGGCGLPKAVVVEVASWKIMLEKKVVTFNFGDNGPYGNTYNIFIVGLQGAKVLLGGTLLCGTLPKKKMCTWRAAKMSRFLKF